MRSPASSVYLLLSGASSLFYPMAWTVSTVYMVEDVELNPFQIVLAGTAQQAANFLFQAPTGVLAAAPRPTTTIRSVHDRDGRPSAHWRPCRTARARAAGRARRRWHETSGA